MDAEAQKRLSGNTGGTDPLEWLTSEVPPEVWYELDYEIARAGVGYEDTEDVDYYRAYRWYPRDGLGRAQFLELEKCGMAHGLGGTLETSIMTTDGEIWIVACDYGY